jgi:hypothetical protein
MRASVRVPRNCWHTDTAYNLCVIVDCLYTFFGLVFFLCIILLYTVCVLCMYACVLFCSVVSLLLPLCLLASLPPCLSARCIIVSFFFLCLSLSFSPFSPSTSFRIVNPVYPYIHSKKVCSYPTTLCTLSSCFFRVVSPLTLTHTPHASIHNYKSLTLSVHTHACTCTYLHLLIQIRCIDNNSWTFVVTV